jgi:hypothetical protein
MKIRHSPGVLLAFGQKRAAAAAIAYEEACLRLAAITAPSGHRSALIEMARRQSMLGMAPVDAVRSVTDDVASGRWTPSNPEDQP